MVRLCFALLLLHKEQYRIHMPRRLMNDLEGENCDEELCECALGNNILSADPDGEDALLLNIRDHRVSGVAHNLICCDGIRKVFQALFHVCSELVLALVLPSQYLLDHLTRNAVLVTVE